MGLRYRLVSEIADIESRGGCCGSGELAVIEALFHTASVSSILVNMGKFQENLIESYTFAATYPAMVELYFRDRPPLNSMPCAIIFNYAGSAHLRADNVLSRRLHCSGERRLHLRRRPVA